MKPICALLDGFDHVDDPTTNGEPLKPLMVSLSNHERSSFDGLRMSGSLVYIPMPLKERECNHGSRDFHSISSRTIILLMGGAVPS